MITHPAAFLRSLYPSLQWRVKTDKKILYLTFDDGPTEGVTEELLDLLKTYQAKASFFCIGKNIEAHPKIFRRILEEGHEIGNHTYHHFNGWKRKNIDFLKDVKAFEKLYQTQYFRPPYGKMKPVQIKLLREDYQIMMWSALSMDYDLGVSKEKCYENANKKLKAGDILLFHDSKKAGKKMMYAVERILKERIAEGYQFQSLSNR